MRVHPLMDCNICASHGRGWSLDSGKSVTRVTNRLFTPGRGRSRVTSCKAFFFQYALFWPRREFQHCVPGQAALQIKLQIFSKVDKFVPRSQNVNLKNSQSTRLGQSRKTGGPTSSSVHPPKVPMDFLP